MLLHDSEPVLVFTLDHRIEALNARPSVMASTPARRARTRLSLLLGWHAHFRRGAAATDAARPAVEAKLPAAMFAGAQNREPSNS